MALLLLAWRSSSPVAASSGINSQLSFEGKIVKSDGTNIANGIYNMEFKIYQDGDSSGVGSTLMWTEDYLVAGSTGMPSTGGVTLTDGTFQVNLGSICAFSGGACGNKTNTAIDWNQQTLWLSMQIGNASSCTLAAGVTSFNTACGGDGEMTPFIRLTAVPQAQVAQSANTLGGSLSASNFVQLAQSLQTDNTTNSSIAINKTGASGDILLLEANSKKALEVNNSGALLLGQAGASGLNGTLLFNNSAGTGYVGLSLQANPGTSYTLLLPTTGPSTSQCLQTDGSVANQLVFNACSAGGSGATSVAYSTTANANGGSISGSVLTLAKAGGSNPGLLSADAQTIGGNKTFQGSTLATGTLTVQNTSTSAFQIQTSGGSSSLLNADTSNMRVGVDVAYALMGTNFGTPTITDGGTGSLTSTSQYYYKITAIDSAGGETTSSTEGTIGATGHTALNISWTGITGASGYRVYRSTASGSETYLTTVLTNSFKDLGALTAGSATVPASNKAYVPTNASSSALQLSIGGLGTPTGQIYISGFAPKDVTSGGVLTQTSHPADIYIQGNYAYVVSYTANKLQIFDISNPAAPVDVTNGGVNAAPSAFAIWVQGKYAYVVNNNSAGVLQVFDVSNPTAPVDVSSGGVSTGSSSFPIDLYVSGRYAYVIANNTHLLKIFDISNPAAPVDVSNGGVSTGINSNPQSVFVQGKYAYVTDTGINKVMVFDISNPAAPVDVSNGGYNITAPRTIKVVGRYAYVVSSGPPNKLTILDVSNPSAISDVSNGGVSLGNSSGPLDVEVQGRYAYASDSGSNQLFVVDISNPSKPSIVGGGGVATSTSPESLRVKGRYAYIVDYGTNMLQVFDVGGEYAQQIQAGGAEVGSLQVNSNAQVSGDFNIQGGLGVGSTLQVNGGISTGSAVTIASTGSTGYVSLSLGSTSSNLSLVLPTSLPSASNYCIVSTNLGILSFLACGAGSTAKVTLNPEYAGAVMTGNNNTGNGHTGTMTSDFCSGSSLLNIAPTPNPCGASDQHNYYAWTANATNDYDIFAQWQAPSDFSSFNSITFNGQTSSASDLAKLTVYKKGVATACGTAGSINTAGTWSTATPATASCSIAAGDILTFDVDLKVAVTGEYARAGEITIVYNRN